MPMPVTQIMHRLDIARRALRSARTVALAVLAGCVLSACSTAQKAGAPTPPDNVPTTRVGGEPQWWRIRVRMGYRDLEQVKWHVDALLADRVFAPLIERYALAITPWRFHRRAAPDESGHQFSFIFYADPAVAARIARALDASWLLDRLRRAGYVSSVVMPREAAPLGSDLGATSDRSWPTEIQRSWPWFIMGVSQHWLALIREVRASDSAPIGDDVETALARYRDIHQRVDALWQNHAQHAYLHHLNAVFAYRLLLLEERRLTRF